MDEDTIMRELTQVSRVVVTAAGQWRERHARAAADRARAEQAALAEDQRRLRQHADDLARRQERRRRDEITAGRSAYAEVRSIRWDQDTTPRRVAEAFVAASALAEHDPVAHTAQAYLVGEVKARYGPRADEWLAAAIAEWQELQRTQADQTTADRDAAEQRAALASPDPQVAAEAEQEADAETAAEDLHHDRADTGRQQGWGAMQAAHAENLADENAATREAAVRASTAEEPQLATSPLTPPEVIAAQVSTARKHLESFPHDPADELNRGRRLRAPRPRKTRDQQLDRSRTR